MIPAAFPALQNNPLRKGHSEMHDNLTARCNYCPSPASIRVVFLDDNDSLLACIDHHGHAWDEAQTAVDTHGAFLPVHVERLALVGA